MGLSIFIRRFVMALLFLALLLVGGTLGYLLIEGWSFGDAFYMSAITVTAVGYNEVHPLSDAGRAFTMLLLGGGLTFMGVWFALITSLIVELDLTHVFRSRRIVKSINALKDHVVVCGAGRTGRQVIHELEGAGAPWVVIERDGEHIEKLLAHYPAGLVITGDATDDEILLQSGLENAKGLVSCLSADTDNLFVCLSARDLAPKLTIIVRAYEEQSTDKLYRAGATHVVSPNVSGAIRMASVLLRPSVVSFLDIATRSSQLDLRMEQLAISSGSSISSKRLSDARIPQETGLIVLATSKASTGKDDFVFNPSADTRLDVGDQLIVLGTVEQIAKLRAYVG